MKIFPFFIVFFSCYTNSSDLDSKLHQDFHHLLTNEEIETVTAKDNTDNHYILQSNDNSKNQLSHKQETQKDMFECQYHDLDMLTLIYKTDPELIKQIVIKDSVVKAQFNEINSTYALIDGYRYPNLKYNSSINTFFQDPTIAKRLCVKPRFRSLLNLLKLRILHLQEFEK